MTEGDIYLYYGCRRPVSVASQHADLAISPHLIESPVACYSKLRSKHYFCSGKINRDFRFTWLAFLSLDIAPLFLYWTIALLFRHVEQVYPRSTFLCSTTCQWYCAASQILYYSSLWFPHIFYVQDGPTNETLINKSNQTLTNKSNYVLNKKHISN